MARAKEGGEKTPGTRRKALNDRLAAELRRLQDDLHTMTEHFEVRLGATLNEIITRLEGDPSIDQPSRPATLRSAQAMLDTIEATRLKPSRARAKDLDRFEKLVRTLSDLHS